MRKFILALMGLVVIMSPLALTTPASASTSSAPTMYAPNVARGKTIPVYINAHGSKVLSRANTLWQNGRRIYDWSPRPGLYKVKSVIRYQIKTTTTEDVWIPDADCESQSYGLQGYDHNADGDYDDVELGEYSQGPYDACAPGEYGYWDVRDVATYSTTKSVTRYDYARVHTDETPGCVSGAEWSAATRGKTMSWVHSMFGTSGTFESGWQGGGDRDVWRNYRACASFGGELSINFDNYSSRYSGMRLYTKYRSW